MSSRKPFRRQPRKTPVQARSQATVVAVLEATIQVLLHGGLDGLTTTKVAARAGVSVGTLYQYFPDKQCLILTVFERHVDAVASLVEEACRRHHGSSVQAMMSAICGAFIDAKVRRRDVARALRYAAAELGAEEIVRVRGMRTQQAMVAMLSTAIEAATDRLRQVAGVLASAIVGAVDNGLAAGADLDSLHALKQELIALSVGYLEHSMFAPAGESIS
jgi:AcrR family transcriptional regulator